MLMWCAGYVYGDAETGEAIACNGLPPRDKSGIRQRWVFAGSPLRVLICRIEQ